MLEEEGIDDTTNAVRLQLGSPTLSICNVFMGVAVWPLSLYMVEPPHSCRLFVGYHMRQIETIRRDFHHTLRALGKLALLVSIAQENSLLAVGFAD